MTTISKEKVNYVRCCCMNVDVFPDILRFVLQKDIPPAQVYSLALAKSTNDRAARVRNPFSLGRDQWVLLQNAATSGYVTFDFTLCYTLIRNLTLPSILPPSHGWGNEPAHPTETTTGDDVERMRNLRNTVYGHASITTIPDTTFHGYWTIAQGVCSRMDALRGGTTYMDMLDEIENIEFVQKKVSEYIDIVTKQIQHDEKLTKEIEELQRHTGELSKTVEKIKGSIGCIQLVLVILCSIIFFNWSLLQT